MLTLLLVILVALLLLPERVETEVSEKNTTTKKVNQSNVNDSQEITPSPKSEPIQKAEEIEKKKSQPQKSTKPKTKKKTKTSKQNKTKRTPKRQKISKKKEPTPPTAPTLIATESSAFSVTVNFSQEATLTCGDGQVREFVGTTKLTFKTAQVCKIEDEEENIGVVRAKTAGAIRCSVSGSQISCR